jgi:hypothetical protein
MLVSNLPILLASPNLSENEKTAIESVYKNNLDVRTTLDFLGRYWKLRVKFSRPVEVRINRYKARMVSDHTFSGFFTTGNGLCYAQRRPMRTGFHFGDWYDLVTDIEVVSQKQDDSFKSYEQFRNRFDTLFITEAKIKELWNSKSSQHGGQYRPSDFHHLGPQGRDVMRRFLLGYQGLGKEGPFYHKSGDYYVYEECHKAYRHSGRDIKISYQTNQELVWYSSEYCGCGNGRYGLVANRTTFLWLEDD